MTKLSNELILNELTKLKELTILGTKNVLSVKDVCTLTGLSKNYIYKLTSKRALPHYKSEGGKIVYFRKDDLENWLLKTRIPAADEVEQKAAAYCVANERGGAKC